MAKLVAKAYGEALFELAMEKQNPEEFLEEAQGILQILEENPVHPVPVRNGCVRYA